MRLAFVIMVLAAIAAGLVAIRKDEMLTSHEMRQLQGRLYDQRCDLWRQDSELADLRVPEAVRRRASQQGITLEEPGTSERKR